MIEKNKKNYSIETIVIAIAIVGFTIFLCCLIIDIIICFFVNDLQRMHDLARTIGYILTPITLIFTVYKYFDQKKKMEELELERSMFELTIKSYFSKTIIDKRKNFIEKYGEIMQRIRNHIIKNADNDIEKLVNLISELSTLKSEYLVWLSEDLNQKLNNFEKDTWGFVIDTRYLNYLQNKQSLSPEHEEKRKELIDKTSNMTEMLSKDEYYMDFYRKFREIFGVEEMSMLYKNMFTNASKYVKHKNNYERNAATDARRACN